MSWSWSWSYPETSSSSGVADGIVMGAATVVVITAGSTFKRTATPLKTSVSKLENAATSCAI